MSAHSMSSTCAFYQYRARTAPLTDLAATLRRGLRLCLRVLGDLIGSSYRVNVAFDRHAEAQRTAHELKGRPGSFLRDLGVERSMVRTAVLDADLRPGDRT